MSSLGISLGRITHCFYAKTGKIRRFWGKFIEHLIDLLELIERVENNFDGHIYVEETHELKNYSKGRQL